MLTAVVQAGWHVSAILVRGGVVMVPLLGSSIVSVAVTIERFFCWRRFRRQEDGERILALVAGGQPAQAMQMARASQHPVARVLLAGLEYPSLSVAMESTAQAELHRLKRYLPLLDTIITLAPLLGLLGTVTGMISAFGIVSEAGLGQPNAITGGVAEALIATATGLAVAILTLLPYNYFRTRAESLSDHIEERASRLELLLQSQQEWEK